MRNVIKNVLSGSIAEEVGIEKGDKLLSINEKEVLDIIDYKFLIVDEEIILEVEKLSGEVWEIEIEKEYSEDIGLEFEDGIMDKAQSCHNKCVFCFIDQLPNGMRDTLYFKDDDSRLSFLQGNFITMTNMKDSDIERIIRYHISPINISVHTTDEKLRCEMLNNRFAGNIYERMKKLSDAGITMNTQIVLCPGINNKEQLIKTVEDLFKLYPQVRNVAAVPIGITKFRSGLKTLETYTKETALEEILLVEKLQEKYLKEVNEPFVRLSDEFYVIAEKEIPNTEFYGDFEQIEDGIGMIRLLRDNINETIDNLDTSISGNILIPTGVSAYDEIKMSAEIIMKKNPKLYIQVIKVINNFFGETITVTGLLTGCDIINQIKEYNPEHVFMCNTMFRKGYELGDYKDNIMLDDITVEEIEKTINTKVTIVDYTGEDLIDIINKTI